MNHIIISLTMIFSVSLAFWTDPYANHEEWQVDRGQRSPL